MKELTKEKVIEGLLTEAGFIGCPSCGKPLTYIGEKFTSLGKGKNAKEFSDTINWICEYCVKYWEVDKYTKHWSGRKLRFPREDDRRKFEEVSKQFSKFQDKLKGRERELFFLGIQIGIGMIWKKIADSQKSGEPAHTTNARILITTGFPDLILEKFKELKKTKRQTKK